MKQLYEKLNKLKEIIYSLGNVAIAYSGGVDSTFLLKTAKDTLGKNVIAITASINSQPERELDEADTYAQAINAEHIIFEFNELNIKEFAENSPNRCYICKKAIFKRMKEIAAEHGFSSIAEGSNIDDNNDYRPGMKAIKELGIYSPLKEAKLTKAEIRELSKEMGLPTWQKQSFACLSSRIPYGSKITKEKLQMISKAEQFLLESGINQVRVRHHEEIARIETEEKYFTKFHDKEFRERTYKELKNIGYSYITLDLAGYRTGSMNETLNMEEKI